MVFSKNISAKFLKLSPLNDKTKCQYGTKLAHYSLRNPDTYFGETCIFIIYSLNLRAKDKPAQANQPTKCSDYGSNKKIDKLRIKRY